MQAGFVLANAQAYWDARALSENLQAAMVTRSEIDQAKGIIMASQHLDADAAFQVMVKQSQHENIKVRDVAREIVQRYARRTSTEPPAGLQGRKSARRAN
jgi:AmiR/NasT family two-component response regulator